jgi:hypothetical protein
MAAGPRFDYVICSALEGSDMSKVGSEGRSYLPIDDGDLRRLSAIALEDLSTYFRRFPDRKGLYDSRLMALALCQGAASHFLDGASGINDFDIYSFFARHPSLPWYAKRVGEADFGDPKFGQSSNRPGFIGRRVDLLGRHLDVDLEHDPADAIRRWLLSGKGKSTPTFLRQKAIVLLWPESHFKQVVWPMPIAASVR